MIGLAEIDRLRRAGLLGAEQYLAAAHAVRDASGWNRWARHALLALGAAQLLAGIVFFFAFNWAALPALAKFGLIEGGLAVAALGALALGLGRPAGQAALIAATVLVGVLLAVTGQVYQAGADAWVMFAAWAALALPFALAACSGAHWLVWLVVAYTAFGLFADQVAGPDSWLGPDRVPLWLGLVTLALAIGRELAAGRLLWLAPRWLRLVLALAAAALLAWPAGGFLLGGGDVLEVALALAGLLGLGFFHLRLRPDLAALAAAAGALSVVAILAGFRLIESGIGFSLDDAGRGLVALALMIAWSVGVTALTARGLRAAQRRMAAPA